MIRRISIILIMLIGITSVSISAANTTTREERKLIMKGNELYRAKKYGAALKVYQEAVKKYPSSAEANYNLGLTMLQIGAGKDLDEKQREKYLQDGQQMMEATTKFSSTKPKLASRASYNLGNIAYTAQNYTQAMQCYKEALRLNPNDNDARRNLRITQLKLNDQNKDNKKDNKNENQNKEQNKNNDNNNQQNQNNNKDNKQEQKPQEQNERMNPDAAKQILQAMENKENQTRSRLINRGKNQNSQNNSRKNW